MGDLDGPASFVSIESAMQWGCTDSVMLQVESRLLQAYVDLKTATLDDALQDFLPEQDPVLGAPLPSTVGAAAHELVNALVRCSPRLLQSVWPLPENPIVNGQSGIPLSCGRFREDVPTLVCCLLGKALGLGLTMSCCLVQNPIFIHHCGPRADLQ